MKSNPLFSVATITYNSANYIRQAIESVLASSYDDFEFLISDDCSTDSTWQIIQKYKDPRIKAWKNENNLGEYPNRNKVISEAKGEFILFVDGDDVLFKHTLRNLAEYIGAFPSAQMIWGVQPADVDFAIMPYLFKPSELMRLIYGTTHSLAVIGFAETVFRLEELRAAGGLSHRYSIGDTYIKKKLALTCNTLFVPVGFVFWRRSDNQASRRVNKDYCNFLEGYQIDCEIIESYTSQDQREIKDCIKGSFIRRLVKNTLLKGKMGDFIDLYKKSGLNARDLHLGIKQYTYCYTPVVSIEQPLYNDFNFSNE
jgi:glycosyltransferase involved in cell wall biosynthesis